LLVLVVCLDFICSSTFQSNENLEQGSEAVASRHEILEIWDCAGQDTSARLSDRLHPDVHGHFKAEQDSLPARPSHSHDAVLQ
jgi:hypothetical protein